MKLQNTLAEIHKIRQHNAKERKMEQKQQAQQHEHFYSCLSEPYSSLEVMYYLNHVAKKAKNPKELEQDLQEIITTQKPILQAEHWNLRKMDNQLQNSLRYSDPQIEFKPVTGLKQVKPEKVIQGDQEPEVTRASVRPKPKNDDYDFGGP